MEVLVSWDASYQLYEPIVHPFGAVVLIKNMGSRTVGNEKTEVGFG